MGENGNGHFNILAIKMTYLNGNEVNHFYGKNITISAIISIIVSPPYKRL